MHFVMKDKYMPKCNILVGLPASGKSTFLEKVQARNVASSDNIIDQIAKERGSTYNEVFADAMSIADAQFWKQIKAYCEAGEDFDVDRTNMSVKSRKRIIDILKPYGYTIDAIVFEKPDDAEWNRRLNSRIGKTIPKHVLNVMEQNFVMPTEAEGFSEIRVYAAS
jgi:predicted kinase